MQVLQYIHTYIFNFLYSCIVLAQSIKKIQKIFYSYTKTEISKFLIFLLNNKNLQNFYIFNCLYFMVLQIYLNFIYILYFIFRFYAVTLSSQLKKSKIFYSCTQSQIFESNFIHLCRQKSCMTKNISQLLFFLNLG